jgi:hypothetical protein
VRLVEVTPGAGGASQVRVEHLDAAKKVLFDWPFSPAARIGEARGQATIIELGVEAGHARWQLISFGAGTECVVHRTHTVDCHAVMSGRLELLLGGGTSVEVGPGDLVLVGGVDHAWRAGSEGALTSATLFGIEPDTDEAPVLPQQIERLTWIWDPASLGS